MCEWYQPPPSPSPTLAAYRFVDYCCMVVDKDLLCRIPSLIQDHMFAYVRDEEALEGFFSEDPGLVKRRRELEGRKDRLTQAAARMASIQGGQGGQGSGSPAPGPGVSGSTNSPMGQLSPAFSSSAVASLNKPPPPPAAASAAPTSNPIFASAGDVVNHAQRMSFHVTVGQHGIGAVVQLDPENRLFIAGFRVMPDNSLNPCQRAGLQLNDIIDQIAGESVNTIDQLKRVLMANKGTVTFTVLRRR